MMRHAARLVCFVAAVWLSVAAAWAQNELDFASRFMQLHVSGGEAACSTISPAMMERLMNAPEQEGNDHVKQVLAQLRSIRVVAAPAGATAEQLGRKAIRLAQDNARRYRPLAPPADTGGVWVRRKGDIIVELVLIQTGRSRALQIIDLTGNMDSDFLDAIMKI